MAVFRDDEEHRGQLDYALLYHGPIHLYHAPEILGQDISWLERHAYQSYDLDCRTWETMSAALQEMYEEFGLPYRLSPRLDGFEDDLSDLEIPLSGGFVLVLRHFDAFVLREPQAAWDILDILANSARRFLLTGQRLLTLLQSDDPGLRLDSVGACPVLWNPQEQQIARSGP